MLKIGGKSLPGCVFMAPMSGVSDWPFREIVQHLGGKLVVSEMIASESAVRETAQSLRMMKATKNQKKQGLSIVQIAGVKPDIMAKAAQLAVDMGADIIDINMGCPAKKIVNTYAGSALMRDLALAKQILRAVVKAVSKPVTLKMRKGWDDSSQNAPELACIAESEGISMVTLHARTRCQLYNGQADWDFFHQMKQATNLPLIANGDIRTPQDARYVMENFGVAGVMMGRGCYGKPWLTHQTEHYLQKGKLLSDPGPKIFYDIVQRHLDLLLTFYGKTTGVRIARKHLGWYSKGHESSASFRTEVNQIEDARVLLNKVEEFYGYGTC